MLIVLNNNWHPLIAVLSTIIYILILSVSGSRRIYIQCKLKLRSAHVCQRDYWNKYLWNIWTKVRSILSLSAKLSNILSKLVCSNHSVIFNWTTNFERELNTWTKKTFNFKIADNAWEYFQVKKWIKDSNSRCCIVVILRATRLLSHRKIKVYSGEEGHQRGKKHRQTTGLDWKRFLPVIKLEKFIL